MNRKKRHRRWRVALLCTAGVGMIVATVYAIDISNYVHPCLSTNDLTCGQPGGILIINAPCSGLTGDLILGPGTLQFNADFTTSGNFSFPSTAATTLTVSPGATATFD